MVLFFWIFVAAWLLQMLFHWGVFSRLAFFKPSDETPNESVEPVSVIVCSHNSYETLAELVPVVLDQDYPNFELVVVNDCSEDETEQYLQELSLREKRVKVVNITQHLNFFHGKKYPLSIGIKSASNDLLLLTDADCKPVDNQWIRKMVSKYKDNTEVVLGYGPYKSEPTLLNKLIRFDTLYTAIQYFSFALFGMPYMGIGRNLSYRKTTFYRNKGFVSHYTIASGDDDLFINQVARKDNTRVCIEKSSRIESEPKQSFREWIFQKRRHYSVGTKYRKNTSAVLGLLLLSRVVYYAALIAIPLLYSHFSVNKLYVFGSLVLTYWLSQSAIYSLSARQLGEKGLGLIFSPLYDIFFTVFTSFIGFWSTICKPKNW